MFYIRAGFTALYVVPNNNNKKNLKDLEVNVQNAKAIHALEEKLTETNGTKMQRLGQARWTAILRLKEACEALSNDNDLEDVISFLAKIVVERDAEFIEHMKDMHEEACPCCAEDEEEEVL